MIDRKFGWLEALRGFAAIWVLIHHGEQSVSHFVGSLGFAPLVKNGYLGVDFFFVLSGFIIAYSALRLKEKGGGIQDYLTARLVRIYVPYLPIGIGIYILYAMLPGLSEGGRSPSLLSSLTLLPTNSPPALSVAWTLVHELIFYAAFAVWFVSKRLWWSLMVIWTGCILIAFAIDLDLTRFQKYFLSPLNLYFALGVGLMYLSRRLSPGRISTALLCIAGMALVFYEASGQEPNRLIVGIGFALVVLAATSPRSSSINVWPWTLTLGAASYAIYLVHNPMLSVLVRVLKRLAPDISPWPGLLIIGVLSALVGLLYWWVYERHALKWVRAHMHKK